MEGYRLTEAQEILIDCLKFLKVRKEMITGIMLMIPKDDQIADMAEFLSKNQDATEEEIVEMALELSEELHESEDVF